MHGQDEIVDTLLILNDYDSSGHSVHYKGPESEQFRHDS
jgi:hypothetical protein